MHPLGAVAFALAFTFATGWLRRTLLRLAHSRRQLLLP